MMNLENQFKVIFFSFIYGMLFFMVYKVLMNVIFKRNIIKILSFFHTLRKLFLKHNQPLPHIIEYHKCTHSNQHRQVLLHTLTLIMKDP